MKKAIPVALTLTAVLLLFIVGGNLNYAYSNNDVSETGHTFELVGMRCIIHDSADGSTWQECKHNTLTTVGTNATMEHLFWIAGDARTNFLNIALGNGSDPVSTDTALDTEIVGECGLSNITGTLAWVGQANVSIQHKWTVGAGCTNIIVNSSGLYNSSTGSTPTRTFLAGASFSDRTVSTDDNITAIHYLWLTIV